jgi:hypothetical protein
VKSIDEKIPSSSIIDPGQRLAKMLSDQGPQRFLVSLGKEFKDQHGGDLLRVRLTRAK